MAETEKLLTAEERAACTQLAAEEGTDGRRAKALLALDEGTTQLAAAEAAGLTDGQLRYFLGKFRKARLSAFSSYTAEASSPALEEAAATSPLDRSGQDKVALRELARELDELIADLRTQFPESAGQTSYSPVRLLTLIRENASKLTPEFVQGIRQSLEGMTAEDLRDLDTWKGLAYMMTYSARFQAGQMGSRIQGHIPEPLQPTRLLDVARKGLDKVLPDIAKQILGTFEGATKEDLLDPDTWKGVWYMINYSLQFQVEQLKERLLATEEK